MTQFKVGDEVQLVRDTNLFNRKRKGTIQELGDVMVMVIFGDGVGAWVPKSILKAHTKRIRPTKSDINTLRQEIAIRNDAIDRLENSVEILQSEKIRLGETNAWLTEQNDALRKEVLAANEVVEKDRKAWKQDNSNNQIEKIHLRNESQQLRHEQAQTALRLYIYQTIAVIAVIGCAVLGAILWVG
jgi:predicted RNase H-like nuclease (RuvC/YqgF family)